MCARALPGVWHTYSAAPDFQKLRYLRNLRMLDDFSEGQGAPPDLSTPD